MASKTQSGQAFSARTMNGIIELDDGAGTIISGGTITTTDIVADNLTTDFITANNLLEANIDETITGKWTFTQPPYIIDTPTEANDAINKGYADGTYATSASLSNYITDASANATFQPIGDYITDASANATFQPIGDYITDASANATFVNKTTGLMETGYTPTTDLQVSTKLYVDSKPIGITEASANTLYVSLWNNQGVSGVKTFNDIFMTAVYTPTSAQQVATKAYVDNLVGPAGNLSFDAIFGQGVYPDGTIPPFYSNCRLQDPTDSPTSLAVGTRNTILGHRAGEYISGAFSRYNTFIGAHAGGNFQKGLSTPSGLGNVFLGYASGDDQTGVGYTYNYTTNIGAYAFPSENNSTNLGGLFVRIHGFLRCPLYEAINTPSLNINTSGNGISLENNVRIFFDNLSGTSNHYTANSHFFTGTLYKYVSGLNYPILSTQDAYTKAESDTRYVRTSATNQTIYGIKTFTEYIYYKPSFVSYRLLSELDAYTKTQIDAFGFLTSASASATYLSIANASSNYLSIVDASNTYQTIADTTSTYTTKASFYNGSNTRLQNPDDSPTPIALGFNNTFVGHRSGQHVNSNLTNVNTFLGFQSGKHFAQGMEGGQGNNFIGANSGWDGINTTPYAYNGTTCLGEFSVATADNQVVLGSSINEVVIKGAFRNEGSSQFNQTANFAVDAFRVISGTSYKLLSELDAYTKTQIDAFNYLTSATASATYQTLALMRTSYSVATNTYYSASFCNGFFFQTTNVKNLYTNSSTTAYTTAYINTYFQTIANMGAYLTTAVASSTYQTIADMANYLTTATASATYATIASLSDYLTTATASATYQTIADMVNYQPKQPKQFTQWRYGVQTTGATTFAFWASNQVLWTTTSGITRGYDRFRYETGYLASGENGGDTQLSTSTGYWTCVVDGMYDIEIQIQSYSTFNNLIYVDFTDTIGFLGSSLMMKTGLTFNATGQAPYANTNTFHTQIFLNAGNGFRIRTSGNGYIYTYNRNTFMIITKMTGY